MRIAILSDNHANLPALNPVLNEIKEKGCDRIYHAGDLICFGHIHPRQFNLKYHGRHFLNSGGVGFSKNGSASYAIIDIKAGGFEIAIEKVMYDREPLLRRYDELEIPDRDLIRKVFFGV